jgi:hypothetical protein
MEQEMAPRLHSFQDKPVNTDAFLLILLLILQRVFPAKRSKAEQYQNRDSTYENQPRRNIAKASKTARFKLEIRCSIRLSYGRRMRHSTAFRGE